MVERTAASCAVGDARSLAAAATSGARNDDATSISVVVRSVTVRPVVTGGPQGFANTLLRSVPRLDRSRLRRVQWKRVQSLKRYEFFGVGELTMQAFDKPEFDEGTVFTATEPPAYSSTFGNATSTAVPLVPSPEMAGRDRV